MSALESKITISAVDRVSSVVKNISKSLDGIAKSTSSLGNSWQKLSSATGDLVGRIRNISLVAIATGSSVFGLTEHYANYAKELELSSIRTGVAVDSLQKLQYAAQLSGASTDSLNQSLKFLNRSIAVAGSNPTSQQAAAFYSMGIKVRDANGHLKDANSLLIEMSSRFQNSTDAAKNTATAMAVFGRAGTQIIPFLREGPEHIKQLESELAKLGHVWTPDELKMGQGFEESFLKLKTSISGVASVIAINLMPVLQPLVEGMTKWIVANKLWLAENIKQGIILFSNALHIAWEEMLKISQIVMPIINSLGGFKNILLILGGLYIARFIVSIGNVIVSLFGFAKAIGSISLALLTTPMGWWVSGIILAGVAVYELIKHWAEFKAYFIKIWPDIQPYVERFLNVVTLGMYGAVKDIYQNWDAIKPYLNATWNWIADKASKVFNSVYGYVQKSFAPIMPYIVSTWEGIKKYFTIVLNYILGLFGTDLDAVEKKFTSVLSSMKSAITDFIGFIEKPFKAIHSLFNGISGKISSIKKSITGKSDSPVTETATSSVANTFSTGISEATQAFNPANVMQNIAPSGTQKIDIHMIIDYEGRPTKVTAKSPNPINFLASVGKMV